MRGARCGWLVAGLVACEPPASLETMATVPAVPAPWTRPGPYRGRQEAAVRANAACESCHADRAAEWRGSYHQRSNTDRAYREAFAIEPSPFCQGCHAPESDVHAPPSREVSELGVGCVTCHMLEEGTVLAAAVDGRDRRVDTPAHAIAYSTDFAHTGGCAHCHEFAFPGHAGNDDASFMQTTVREHARSPAAERSCASCHMSEGSHDFAGVRDARWLRRALDVRARCEAGRLVIEIAQRDPGHAFPTGDLFRRVEVGAESAAARELHRLSRQFETWPGARGRQLTLDNRVFDEPLVIDFDVACDAPLRWWVSYQRVAQAFDGRRPAAIESEILIASGSSPEGANAP